MTSHQPEITFRTSGDPVVVPNPVVDFVFFAMVGTLATGSFLLFCNKFLISGKWKK